MSQTVVLKVGMSCEGCVGAVKRVLGKLDAQPSSHCVLHSNCFLLRLSLHCVFYQLVLSSTARDARLEGEKGVESYDIDLKEQKVVVKGNVQPDTVLATVSKTGKKTTFWEGETAASETSTATA
ncbi:hypothetical protein glysoja_000577 [Glycine soja]|nr:hypothetical protein glysoja_000577 [Glycine soja]